MRHFGLGTPGASTDDVLASLLMWVSVARVVVIAAAVVAAAGGLAAVWRGRLIEGVVMGAAGVAAAVTAQVIIGYVAWRARAGVGSDALRPPTETNRDHRVDLG